MTEITKTLPSYIVTTASYYMLALATFTKI